MNQRNDALINGALIAIGTIGVLDNIIVHWMLKLHRAVPGCHAFAVELGLVAVSIGLLTLGSWREWRARRAAQD
jgi:hypothetical protein